MNMAASGKTSGRAGGTDMESVTLAINGMSCGHCVAAVKRAIEGLPGVKQAEVTLDPPRAKVSYDPAKVGPQALAKAVEEEGYTSSPVA
jgi:copper chaperone